ncbi:MAG TPA: VOC family protein [bacterium]
MGKKLTANETPDWCTLATPDVEAAKKFYGALFGWKARDTKAGGKKRTVVSTGAEQVAGMMALSPNAGGPQPVWGISVSVDDVDASVERARRLDATVIMDPTDVPGVGRLALLLDPQGEMLSVISYDGQ